jgi:imidazolonepropionase-like amidohydrolase
MFVGADHEGARGNVRRWKEGGAQFIKVHYPITWAVQRAVAEEARRLGLPVLGHGTYVEEITKSVTLGYTTLEHSDRPYDDVFQMLALAGTRWDPTLTNAGRNALLFRDEPERLADLKFRAFQPEWQIRRARRGGIWKDKSDRALRARWIEVLAGIRAAHRHGVKLLAGTDAPLGQIFSGTSLHWELEYLVEAGLAPVEVLRIATQEAAATVGAEDDLGTLEVDKLADIVLLDANPLEDIKNTQTIWRVIKGGVVFDPEELSR